MKNRYKKNYYNKRYSRKKSKVNYNNLFVVRIIRKFFGAGLMIGPIWLVIAFFSYVFTYKNDQFIILNYIEKVVTL